MDSAILITGHSQGLGQGLCDHYLEHGQTVVGVARKALAEQPRLRQWRCDLGQLDKIPARTAELFSDCRHFSVVYLNAGVLGDINDLADTPLADLKMIMDVNLWANKLLLDGLIRHRCRVDQVVMISSGAAINGHRGWGGYALSKAALNMLAQLYATEMPDSHLVALAPGLVDTAMQVYLCERVDQQRFPSVSRLAAARHTQAMPGPREAAENIVAALPRIRAAVDSGGFVDLRQF